MNTLKIDTLALAAEASAKLHELSSETNSRTDGVASVDGFETEPSLSPAGNSPNSPVVNRNDGRKPNFADKLHAILGDKKYSSIIAWLPSGKSFTILDRNKFATIVLPKFFSGAQYESFSRRIKRWGFHTAYANGTKSVVFTHSLFVKGRLDLCELMNEKAHVKRQGATQAQPRTNATQESGKLNTEPSREIASPTVPSPLIVSSQQNPRAPWVPPRVPTCEMHESVQFDAVHSAATFSRYPARVEELANTILQRNCPRAMAINMANDDAQMQQLSALNEEIGDLEEQLVILHRLRALRERRRGFGN